MTGVQTCALPISAGWTSFDVLAKLRGALGTRKLGHSGTLDPMATGVLAVFISKATAAADRQLDHDKTYEATLRLATLRRFTRMNGFLQLSVPFGTPKGTEKGPATSDSAGGPA